MFLRKVFFVLAVVVSPISNAWATACQLPTTATGGATVTLQGEVFGSGTGPCVLWNIPLLGGTDGFTSGNPGYVTGGVTINLGGSAVSGSNLFPVTLGAGSAAIGSVTVTGTAGVSNSGTFAVQNTAATPAGTNAIGTIGVTALPALPAGTNTIGKVDIDQTTPGTTNGVQVNNFPSTQPISAASLPLPTGAALSADQTNVQSAPGTPQTVAITIQGNASGIAVPISAGSLPLPSGAATAANQVAPTVAGTSATSASAIQGVTGGVAMPTSRALGVWTDRSGTVTTGGTSQTLAAINTVRKALFVYNPVTATEPLCVNFTSAASASSAICFGPGGTYTDPPNFQTTELVTVTAATTGHAFVAKEGQ